MRTFKEYVNRSNLMIGYKVMSVKGDKIVSTADSKNTFPFPKIGSIIRMGGKGIYLGSSKEFVLDYYSGLAEQEILITFEFNPDDITTGNITDREWETAVPSAKVVDIAKI